MLCKRFNISKEFGNLHKKNKWFTTSWYLCLLSLNKQKRMLREVEVEKMKSCSMKNKIEKITQ